MADATEVMVEKFNLDGFTRTICHVSDDIKFGSYPDATRQQWLDNQAFNVAEEAGEFIGEWRRLNGLARRQGDRAAMLSELSDVIISAMIMFHHLDEDPEQHIRAKLRKIVTRGFVNKD